MSKKSRTKGACGEREVVAIAIEHGYPRAVRAAPMQAGGGDSEFADVANVGLSFVEAKRYKKTPVNRFANEYLTRERPGFVPVLAWRDDGSKWFAAVNLEDWFKLTRELEDLRVAVKAP